MAKVKFTAGRVNDFKCQPGKNPAFLWDATQPGLGLRATSGGGKSYIFQAKLRGQVIRTTIGAPSTWSIEQAQAEARRLKIIIDSGQDPRKVKADKLDAEKAARDAKAAEATARQKEALRQSVTLSETWPLYLQARKAKWSEGHYKDHEMMATLGGQPKKRGSGLTTAGPLAALMPLPLTELTGERIAAWLEIESTDRPTAAALSFRLLRAFAGWAADTPAFRGIVPPDAFTARIVRDHLPKNETKEGDS